MSLTPYNLRCFSATDVWDLHALPLTAMVKPDFTCSPSHECASTGNAQSWGAGINTIIFYAPQLFLSLGVRTFSPAPFPRPSQLALIPLICMALPGCWSSAMLRFTSCDALSCGGLQGSQQNALIATVIVGLCNHFSTYISFWLADHYGRRFLFIE